MNNMMIETSSVKKLTTQALSIFRKSDTLPKSNDFASIPSRLNTNSIDENQIHIDNEENVEEKQEFSFTHFDPQGAVIFADEIFDNGKIRPTYVTFDHSLVSENKHDYNTLPLPQPLKKLFIVEQHSNFSSQSKGIIKGLCKDTSEKMTMVEVEATNNKCKKSKSTGFSKTWRFRENLKLRSNSDGKDAFVFLNRSRHVPMKSNETKEENVVSKKGKGGKCNSTMSPHEKLYLMNKKRKENSKQQSFLPYKRDLIGFFANTNGFSMKISPF